MCLCVFTVHSYAVTAVVYFHQPVKLQFTVHAQPSGTLMYWSNHEPEQMSTCPSGVRQSPVAISFAPRREMCVGSRALGCDYHTTLYGVKDQIDILATTFLEMFAN